MSAIRRGLALLSGTANRLIAVFTVVEVLILTVWLLVLFPAGTLTHSTTRHIIAGLILLVGLGIEHYIAGASNKV